MDKATAITVRPMDPATEQPYVLATSTDALLGSHGGKFARRELVRDLTQELLSRSAVTVATWADDAECILGFALWAGESGGIMELLYLRKSLSRMQGGRAEPLQPAYAVTKALLGDRKLVRMRRVPPEGWAWRTLHALGYVPLVMPEAL